MSIRKKIAAVLAAVMTATTLSIPAYAADLDKVLDFVEFIKSNTTVEGNVVKLNNDITLDTYPIGVQKSTLESNGYNEGVVIDLNGHTVTYTTGSALINYDADVTIKNGKLVDTSTGYTNYAIRNLNTTDPDSDMAAGNTTVEDLIIEGGSGAIYNTYGTVTVNSGTFSARLYQAVYNLGGYVILNNGIYNSGIYDDGGSITINGGTYNSSVINTHTGVSSTPVGDIKMELVINGGSFKNRPDGANITLPEGKTTVLNPTTGMYELADAPAEPAEIAYLESDSSVKYTEEGELKNALETLQYANIHLCADIKMTSDWTINNTLKLCGHKITGNGYTITLNGTLDNSTEQEGLVTATVVAAGEYPCVQGNVHCTDLVLNDVQLTFSPSNNRAPIMDKITGDCTKTNYILEGAKFLKEYFDKTGEDGIKFIDKIKVYSNQTKVDTNDGYYTVLSQKAKNVDTGTIYYYFADMEKAFAETIGQETPVKFEMMAELKDGTITIPEGANIDFYGNGKFRGSSKTTATLVNNGTLTISNKYSNNQSYIGNTVIENNGTCNITNGSVYATLSGTGTYNISGGSFQFAVLNNSVNCVISGGTFATGVLAAHPEWIAEGYEVNSAGTGVQKKVALPTMTTSAATIFTGVNDTKAAAFTTTVQGAEGYTISKFHWNVTSNNVKKFSKEALTDGKTIEGAGEFIFGLIIDGLDDTGAVAKGVINDSIIEQ